MNTSASRPAATSDLSTLPPPPPPVGPPVVVARPGWRAPAVLGVAAVAGTALIALADPTGNHLPLCPLKAITGLDCSFCGGLRSVQALTQGDLASAFDHNALFVASIPLLVVAWMAWLLRGIRWPERPPPLPPRALRISLWVVVLGFGVVRNLPILDWLASGA